MTKAYARPPGPCSASALLQEPYDRCAQLRDAVAAAGRGREEVGKGGGVSCECGLRGRDAFGQLGVGDLVGLGEHDLIIDRRLIERGQYVFVIGLEAVASIDQQVDTRER